MRNDQSEGNGLAEMLNRMSGLFKYWNFTPAAGNTASLQDFHGFVSDARQAFDGASRRQLETFLSANERIAAAMSQMMQAHEPQAIVAAQMEVAKCITEAGMATADTWVDLAQKVQKCSFHRTPETAGTEEAKAATEPMARRKSA